MKKLIILFIIILLLVSCSSSSNKESEKPSLVNQESATPTISETSEDSGLLTINYTIFDKDYEEDIEKSWETYFEHKYGVKIILNYLNMKKNGIGYISDEELDGVMYLTHAPGYIYNKYIYSLIDDGKLYDLSKYYEEYTWQNDIEPAHLKPVTIGGKIFAIPVVSNTDILPRYYNKEYIEALGLKIPTTIGEFTEYLTATSIAYPETPPAYFSTLSVTHSTADIFRGFDVYLNANDESSICFNPKTNSFEDGVFSENFVSALSYIRMLQESNLMEIFKPRISIELPLELVLATEYNCTYYNGMTWPNRVPTYEFVTGYYLEGTNKEKLVEARKNISFYTLPVFTKSADSLMRDLNRILTWKEYSFDLQFGIEGLDYYYDSDISDVIIENDFLGIIQLAQKQTATQSEKEAWNFINNHPSSLIFETNTYFDAFTFSKMYTGDELLKFKQVSGFLSVPILMDLFNMEIATQDSIKAYKDQFYKYNIQEFIDDMNDRLGFTTTFNY